MWSFKVSVLLEASMQSDRSASKFLGNLRRFVPILGAIFASTVLIFLLFFSIAFASQGRNREIQIKEDGYDFAIDKSNDPQVFIVGDGQDTHNRYIINLRNKVLPIPKTLIIRDRLPPGITVDDVTATDWFCETSADFSLLSCFFYGFPPPSGSPYPPIIINVDVAPTVSSQVTNTAELHLDGHLFSSSAPITTTIDSVDLNIEKTASIASAEVGGSIDYRIDYSNSGPAIASDVKIVDVLPATLNILSVSPPPDIVTATSTLSYFTWLEPSLGTNITHTILMTASPTQAAYGRQLTNDVSITSSNRSDWNATNNTASATVFVSGLEIEKQILSGTRTLPVGEPFTYRITVKNNGAEAAYGVIVADIFDPGLTVLGASLNGVPFLASSNNFNRSIGTMPASTTATIDVTVRGNSTVTVPITVTNQATVHASPSIIETSIITDTGFMTITPATDLSVLIADNFTNVYPGQLVTYTVTIQNIGSVITQTNFTVTDILLNNLEFVSMDLGTLEYTPTFTSTNNALHVWQIGELLDPDESISYKITARVPYISPTGVTATHRVTVLSPYESYLGNNTADDVDDIIQPPFTFNLFVDRSSVQVGEELHFHIILANVGNYIVRNVRVTDAFPSTLDPVSGYSNPGIISFDPSTHTVMVSLEVFNPGQQVEIFITTRVNSTAPASKDYDHISILTFDPGVSVTSNTVHFLVINPIFTFKQYLPVVLKN
jgi:uncharacterized repeat protein (TIGR01451 family)